ncbi:hypothetical protein B0H16DRAFT_1732187 [Mycena metata]|uniref:Uncharacterized protein n=1 Tax=Mycena metata TaxID=1033252 RepID=A0AAD7I2H5_9AGAR|nr:hypothetical protein B0H16DRAFT_1732187 [Mycena metata]
MSTSGSLQKGERYVNLYYVLACALPFGSGPSVLPNVQHHDDDDDDDAIPALIPMEVEAQYCTSTTKPLTFPQARAKL